MYSVKTSFTWLKKKSRSYESDTRRFPMFSVSRLKFSWVKYLFLMHRYNIVYWLIDINLVFCHITVICFEWRFLRTLILYATDAVSIFFTHQYRTTRSPNGIIICKWKSTIKLVRTNIDYFLKTRQNRRILRVTTTYRIGRYFICICASVINLLLRGRR